MKRSNKGAHPPSSPNNINTRRSRPRTELSTATTEERHSPTLRRTDLTVPPSSRTSITREPVSSSSSSIPLSTRSPSKTSNDRWNDPTTMRGRRELDTQQSGSGRSNVETSKAADASKPQPKGQRVNGEDGHPLIAVVSNLAWHVTMDDLWLLFGDIGEVQEIVMKKGADGRFSGIAEVQYVNADDADRCLEAYSDVTFDNRAMRIRLINPLQPPPPHHPRDRREERRDEMVGQKFQDVRRRRPVKPFGESMGQRGDSTNRDGKLDSIQDFSPAKAHSHSEEKFNMQQPRNLSQNHPPCRQQPREQDRYQQQPRAPADGLPPQRRSAPSTFPNRRVSEREQYDEERRRQRNLRDRAGMRWDNNPPHPPPDSWNRRSGNGSDPQWSRNNGPNSTNPTNHHQHQHRQHRHSLDKERRFLDSKINGAGQTCPTFDPDQNVPRTNLHPPSSQRRSRSPPPPLHSDRQTGPGPVNDQPGGNSLDFRRNGNAGRGPNKRFYQSHRDRDLGRNRPRPY